MFWKAPGLAAGLPSGLQQLLSQHRCLIDALCSVNNADKSNPRVIPCLLLSLFVCLPQENDLNNMLNSLYDLPVPKPFTPVNLSVVSAHTTRSSGREGGPVWGGKSVALGSKNSKSRARHTNDQLEKKKKQRNNENLNTKDSDAEEMKMAQKQAGGK